MEGTAQSGIGRRSRFAPRRQSPRPKPLPRLQLSVVATEFLRVEFTEMPKPSQSYRARVRAGSES